MSFWIASNLAQVTGGRWLVEPVDTTAMVRGVSTDTRSVGAGQAFLAIKGEKLDGHDFLDVAGRAGASVLIVAKPPSVPPASISGRPAVLLVSDTLMALHRLAVACRDELRKHGCKVIAVAGSNGKTTTRHLIHSLLSASLRGTQSPKSFNNHIGVPLTLLGAREADAFVVVEIGTNHPGEVDALGAIVRPDAAVVTSIGQEHLEFFKTLAGVAAEEARIFRYVVPGGLLVVTDDALMDGHIEALGPGFKVRRFGESPRADLRLTSCRLSADNTLEFSVNGGAPRRMRLIGRHNALNAIAALAVGQWMGLREEALAQTLADCTGMPMRLAMTTVGKPPEAILLLNDAYNANPDSMAAALRTLAAVNLPGRSAAGRRVAILGDMLELGDTGPDAHRQIGTLLAQIDREGREAAAKGQADVAAGGGGIDQVVVIGRLAMFIAQSLARAWPVERVQAFGIWDAAVPARVAELLRPGDAVLVKASRGMGLERLLPEIEKRFA